MIFNTGSEKSLFHYTSMTTLVIGSDLFLPIDINLDLVSILNQTLNLIIYVTRRKFMLHEGSSTYRV